MMIHLSEHGTGIWNVFLSIIFARNYIEVSHEFKKKYFIECFLLSSATTNRKEIINLRTKFHVALQGHFIGQLLISLTVVDLRERE